MSDEQKIVDAVLAAARERDGRLSLSCAEAFKLAGQFNVKPIVIGNICNEQKIKLCGCQLGCFK